MANSEQGRVYGGVSAADREAERTRRLLDAGLQLFGTRGIAQVTVGDICVEARLTKRYFYARYSSIEQFVDAVMDDVRSTVARHVLPAGDGLRGVAAGRARLTAFVETIAADPRVARLMLVETFGAEGNLGRFRQQMVHKSVEVMVSVEVSPGHRAPDPIALRMTAFALSGAFAELLLAWLEGEVEASVEEIIAFLSDLFSQVTVLTRPRSR
jgi:AcrR family transcriptional regulator